MMKNSEINLFVRPEDTKVSYADFAGPYKIAIDGYVAEAPKFDEKLPCANFNHHEGVSRLETRATSAQVLLSVRMGLFKTFRFNNIPKADVFCNDCDEDVGLTWFILLNHVLAESIINPMLNRLVSVAELMDTTAGMLPLSPDSYILREMAWIFRPYREFRVNGGLDRRKSEEFRLVIDHVCDRVMSHITGSGEAISLDISYIKIGGGNGWSIIEEVGMYGRQGALFDGVKAFVSVRKRSTGLWSYSIGRISEFIPFPVQNLLTLLNIAEAHALGGQNNMKDSWGGGTTIGGSPRTVGSKNSPEKIEFLINKSLELLADNGGLLTDSVVDRFKAIL